MKKNFIYALLGAIALTGAASLTACSSSDEIVDNPNYDPETNTVKTQFAISIPNANGQVTRMSANGAPNSGEFKGIKEIKLYPISVNTDANGATASSTISTPIELENITAFNQKGSGDNSFNGKVYSDVNTPAGTKAFLFYGEITNEEGGNLTTTYGSTGTTSGISFALEPLTSQTFSSVNTDEKGGKVLGALNAIMTELTTKEQAAESAAATNAIKLNSIWQSFKALRAGSAASVLAFVQKVYNELSPTETTYEKPIRDKIEEYFTASGTTLAWTTANDFPRNLGLPDGAVGVNYATTFAFSNNTVGGNPQPELNTYVKPASLFYTVNTPIKTSTTTHVDEYKNQTTWEGVLNLYSDTEVRSSTRGVVLTKPIQFAVGRLKTQVKIASSETTLKANDGNGGTKDVTKPAEGYSYSVKAILIGNQKNVDWKFEPVAGESYFTIYDPVQTGGESVKATTTASEANYTLALQTEKDAVVNVVVELVNDGEAFYGINDQLIPSGSKFYLVAALDPKLGTTYTEGDDAKNRVFCQDVETTVEFTIGENSLKKAYNTIPDLREAKMELGLSVNLEWKAGLSFNINL